MRIWAYLSDEKRFWPLLAFVCGLIAVLKGLRLPNLWSATQAQVNYEAGFLKRGLFGEILTLLHLRIDHYATFAALSFGLLTILLILLVRRAAPVEAAEAGSAGVLAALFFSSFSITYLIHCVGYFDIPLIILMLLAVGLRAPQARLWGAALLGGAAVLIHEFYCLAYFPMTLLPTVLEAIGAEAAAARRWRLAGLGATLLSVGGLTVLMADHPSLTPAQAEALLQSIVPRVDFPVRSDVFDVFQRSAFDNLTIIEGLMQTPGWWADQALAALAFGPTAALLLALCWRMVGALFAGWRRLFAAACVAAACLSPLLMQALAWDIYRWNAAVVLDAFVATTILRRLRLDRGGPALALDVGWRNLIVLTVALNMATSVGFFDAVDAQTFPFKHHWQELVRFFDQGGQWSLPAH